MRSKQSYISLFFIKNVVIEPLRDKARLVILALKIQSTFVESPSDCFPMDNLDPTLCFYCQNLFKSFSPQVKSQDKFST